MKNGRFGDVQIISVLKQAAVMAGLLSSLVHEKPLLRPETRLWPAAAQFGGCARGHDLSPAIFFDVPWPRIRQRKTCCIWQSTKARIGRSSTPA